MDRLASLGFILVEFGVILLSVSVYLRESMENGNHRFDITTRFWRFWRFALRFENLIFNVSVRHNGVHLKTFSSRHFTSVYLVRGSTPWFVDFFAPWCPPCMQLLPEFRKAARTQVTHLSLTFDSSTLSKPKAPTNKGWPHKLCRILWCALLFLCSFPPHYYRDVIQVSVYKPLSPLQDRDQIRFATVDCTVHGPLCNKYNIHSYPTTVLYNNTKPQIYSGHHTSHYIAEFIEVRAWGGFSLSLLILFDFMLGWPAIPTVTPAATT